MRDAGRQRIGFRRVVGLGGALAVASFGLVTFAGQGVLATVSPTITGITVSNDCFDYDTSGTVTVTDPVAGTITVEVFAHVAGGGGTDWVDTGAGVTITTNTTDTTYDYQVLNIPSEYFDTSNYNTLRVQILSATPSGWAGTTTKSGSFDGCSPLIVSESPLAIALPITGLVLIAGAFALVVIRRRRGTAAGI